MALPTVPVRHPDEQRAAHVADLEDGEDDARAGVAFGWEAEVGGVVREGIDGAHQGAVEACMC